MREERRGDLTAEHTSQVHPFPHDGALSVSLRFSLTRQCIISINSIPNSVRVCSLLHSLSSARLPHLVYILGRWNHAGTYDSLNSLLTALWGDSPLHGLDLLHSIGHWMLARGGRASRFRFTQCTAAAFTVTISAIFYPLSFDLFPTMSRANLPTVTGI